MRKFLLSLLLLLGTLGTALAQSNIVVMSSNPDMLYEDGETMSFTVTVTNNGPDPASNVNIYFPIPAGITIPTGVIKFWWSGTNGSSGNNVAVNNTITSLTVNQTVTYTINVKIPNDYTAIIPEPLVTWKTQSDIKVINTDNQATYTPGTTVEYTVTVINQGPEATTTGVQVSNTMPGGMSNYQWTDANGNTYTTPMAANTGVLAVGQQVTYTVSFDVPASYTGNLTNTVAYTANAIDPTPGCTQCTDVDVQATGADIVANLTDGNLTYTPGGTSVYTLTVTNNGPNNATAVNVLVPVPTGITGFTWTGSNSSSGTGALANTIPALANGATVTYTITVDVPAAYTGALSLTASTTSTPTDPDTSCTTCTDTDYDATSADITVIKTLESGATYTAGTNAVYTITVTNVGPTAAQNVVVNDLIPAGLGTTGAYWTSSNGGFGTGNLEDTIDLLEADDAVTYTFTIPVPSGFDQDTDIVNMATATSDTPDPDETSNTATHTATPNPLANLVTVKTNYQSTYIADTTTEYTITVSNPGPSDAYNVVVNDPKPYYITFMTWEGNGTGGSGSLNNTIPVIPAGETVTYTVTVTIPEDYASYVGSLTNTVTVTSTTPDPAPGCTTCTDTDTAAVNFVTTNTNQYTIPELVEDVLIDVNCVGIDNVTSSTGTNYGTSNGIAYFNANNSTFPIQEGVVLTCGNAVPSNPGGSDGVDGPNPVILSNSPGWPGDTELQTYIPGANNDASWIKFNFVPVSNSFSFNYLFASEEYGTPSFECNYTDVFAFILTDLTNNTSQNLAVLPNTTTTVGVTTVHLGGPGCAPANPTYFGQYNTGASATTAPINFNGQTVVMTASATVIPNHEYSIKLVIANGGDHAYNSAVFIEAGSFDIGQPQLPGDITLGNQALLLCYGDTYELEATATNPDMLVKWQKDGQWLMEEDGVTFVEGYSIPVTEPGTYTVMGYFASNPDCFLEDDIVIDFYPEINAAEAGDLHVCDDDPAVDDETWDLTENNEVILAPFAEPENYYVAYYNNLADIETGEPGIWPDTTYNPAGEISEDGYTMYAMVQDMTTLCYVIREFKLYKDPSPTAGEPEDMHVCDEEGDGQAIFDLTTQAPAIYGEQDPTVYGIMYFSTLEGAQAVDDDTNPGQIINPEEFLATNPQTTIYVRLYNMFAPCYDITQFDVFVTPLPDIQPVADVEACDSYTLPALSAGEYFSQPNGVGAITNTTLTTSQTVYIYQSEGVAPNACTSQTSFEVTIYNTPSVPTPANVAVCDSYVLPALAVGQYYTEADGNGDVVAADTEITTTTTLYIYAQSGNGDDVVCTDQHMFTVTVNYAPVVGTATPLEECDDNNNGLELFDLTAAGAEVVGTQTGLEVSYHITAQGAQDDTGEIDNPAQYQNPASNQAFIRVITAGTTTNCATVVPVSLIVHPRPVIPALADYALCDDNNSPDGIEEFDLTTRNTLATSNTSDVVTWYASQDAANAGTTPVDDATAFSSSTNTQAWVRVENTFGCYSVAPLTLVVHPLPAVAQNMEPFYACEETPGVGLFDFDEIDPVVTQGASGYSVAYYETPEQAAGGLDDYLTSPHPSASAVIYARVENVVTGCSVIAPVTLEVLPAPIAPELAPLQECDDNNDGIATFSLSGTIAGIEAALGNTVEVTVHYTPEDADFGTNEITNITAFTNNDPGTQTLYLRVESSQTECFDVAELVLIVNPAPVATTPSGPYVLCDNGTSDTDGVGVFDLTLYEEEVLGTLDPALYSVTYFNNEAQAMAGTPAIATPASYNSTTTDGDAPEDAIYIRVTNNATGCYDLVELELIVNPLPTALQPTEPYTLCDDNTDPEDPGVEFEIFDLTSKIDEITDGLDGVTVTFYQEYADAVGLVNGISNPEAYVNATPAVETIFVRVTDNETGCYRIVLQDIRVEPLPLLVMPSDAETTACDTDGDGYATFDLTALIEGMLNTGTDITVSFYETAEDALEGINAIPNPEAYANSNPFLQTIYVVGENDLTGCQSPVWSFALHVTESPQAPDLEDIVQCDDQDNDGQDGQAYFDLTIYEADIYETIDTEPGTLTIQYFTSEAYADAGAPRITNPSHYNGTHDQVIWVRVELTGTECYSLSSFQLMLNRPQALTRPSMLVLCNEALDGNEENDIYTTFDLTVKDAEILGPMGIGIGNVVTYHETQAAAQDGVDAITPATAYENESNPQVLYVRVVTPEGCVSFTTLTIKVLPLPTPDFTPDALELCDTNNTGDGVEPFNLTDAQDDIADNDFTVSFAYYPTEADVYAGTNEIVAPQTYVSGTGSVWVKVMANTNNATDPVCFQVVELPLIVHPLPAQGTIAPYAICEQNTDGFATFDFNTHMDEILGPDVDPADYGDYTVRFSYNGANVPYIYTNVVQGSQTIDVYVEYEPTACSTTVQLTLLVEEQAIAYEVTTPDFDVCDNDGDNDGFYVIDLTQADADIIGVQNPAIHAVTYYTSEQDALDGTNAIATPATFNATTQTIWARIVNTSTVSGCPDFTSFEVVIELLPEPVISTDGDVHTICVDFATGEVLRPLLLQSGVTPNGHTYDWYHNGQLVDTNQNGTYLAEEPGSYTVIVTGPAPNGCISDVSAAFEVIQSGPPSPIGQGFVVSNAFGEDQTITVLVEGYGEYQYSLYPEGPWQNSNVFTNVSPGEHTVYIRDITADPCTDPYDTVTNVSVINYPHYFTPNGDGYNDTWNIIGLAGEDYQAIIYIFDRYGKLIKQISPDGQGWDGTYNGYPVTADDYWFTVEFNEGLYRRTVKAHFALKR